MKKPSKTVGLLIVLLISALILIGMYVLYVLKLDALNINLIATIVGAGFIAIAFFLVVGTIFAQLHKEKKDAAKEKDQQTEQEAEGEEIEEVQEEESQEETPTEEPVEEIEEEKEEEAPVEEEEEPKAEEPVSEPIEEEPAPQEEEAQEEVSQEEAGQEESAEEEPQQQEEVPVAEEPTVAEENKDLQEEPMAVQEEEPMEEEPVKEVPKVQPAPQIDASIAALLAQQVEFNKNVDKRLEKIDQSLKMIADALRGLIYDAVPEGTLTVPVTPQEEVPQADGGDYFDQMQEEEVAPAPVEEVPQEEEEQDNSWIATADQDLRIKPKMSFDMRLRVADDDIKKFYSEIKNELLSYGIHDRLSRHRENFNQGRINICRMVINGKTLKVYLAVDPESIDKRYFHHTDVGHRKGLVELPTMINVRSKVAARKVKELITLMMESLVISKKPYEQHDFAADLTLDGYTTIESKGYDYLVEKSMTLEKAKEYPDNFAAQLVDMVEDNEYQERFIKTTLTIDDLLKHFKDGDVVDIDKVRELGVGPANSNFLSIKESAKINKKLKVYANEFTPDAVKMICLSGGETFLVVQPEQVVEES